MIVTGSLCEARTAARRRVYDTERFRGVVDVLFETPKDEIPTSPQAMVATQPPNFVLATHYHRQDQFQLVIRGDGTLGRHPLKPFSVHFASRESAYGPITAGPQGLEYFTLRGLTDHGAYYMPESRELMQPGLQKFQVTAECEPASSAQGKAGEIQTEVAIEPTTDGLAAWITHVPEQGTVATPRHGACGGVFNVIVEGSFACRGEVLPTFGCVFQSGDEAALELEALGGGGSIITMQFPLPS